MIYWGLLIYCAVAAFFQGVKKPLAVREGTLKFTIPVVTFILVFWGVLETLPTGHAEGLKTLFILLLSPLTALILSAGLLNTAWIILALARKDPHLKIRKLIWHFIGAFLLLGIERELIRGA